MDENDIIQVVDKSHPWFLCLLIVGDVKPWGVQACALIPKSNDGSEPPAQAWSRLAFSQVEKVGKATFGVR